MGQFCVGTVGEACCFVHGVGTVADGGETIGSYPTVVDLRIVVKTLQPVTRGHLKASRFPAPFGQQSQSVYFTAACIAKEIGSSLNRLVVLSIFCRMVSLELKIARVLVQSGGKKQIPVVVTTPVVVVIITIFRRLPIAFPVEVDLPQCLAVLYLFVAEFPIGMALHVVVVGIKT